MFDDIISEKLGYPINEYIDVIDSLDEEDADFIMSATFEMIVEEEEGRITDIGTNEFLMAKDMFATFHESFFKKSAE